MAHRPTVSATRRLHAALTARYDGAALQVEPPLPIDAQRLAAAAAARPEPWAALASWCIGDEPLAVATLHGPDMADLIHRVQAFARELDGSVGLASAPGALARLRIRLVVKLHDAMPWRARQASDPWDCGWFVAGPVPREALGRFRPRRATLIACAGPADEAAALLRPNREAFAHPVRLLGIEPAPGAVRLSAASPCGGSTGTAR